MKHEVKYQELSDEQLTFVAGGYGGRYDDDGDGRYGGGRYGGRYGRGHDGGYGGGDNGGGTANTTQGSPIALNLNIVNQFAILSKNVSQTASTGQVAGASNNG